MGKALYKMAVARPSKCLLMLPIDVASNSTMIRIGHILSTYCQFLPLRSIQLCDVISMPFARVGGKFHSAAQRKMGGAEAKLKENGASSSTGPIGRLKGSRGRGVWSVGWTDQWQKGGLVELIDHSGCSRRLDLSNKGWCRAARDWDWMLFHVDTSMVLAKGGYTVEI